MLKKLFGFDATQHKVRTEIFAGITTFLTMAYILAVNPGIFSALKPMGKQGLRQISPTVWVLFVIFVLRYVQKSL